MRYRTNLGHRLDTVQTEPARFVLGQRMRYRLLTGVGWSGPMRVIGRQFIELAGMPLMIHHTLQPHSLTGCWAEDQPIAGIFEQDVEALDDEALGLGQKEEPTP